MTAAALTPVGRTEFLSILLQNLLADPPAAVFAAATLALRQALATPLDTAEHAVVANAARELFERGAAVGVDRLATHLLVPLRRIAPEAPARLLQAACMDADPVAIRAVWPHAVNELLLGTDGLAPEVIDTLRRLATGLPEAEMQQDLTRLEALDALREGSFARRPCVPLDPTTAPLCLVLLESSRGDLFGAALLSLLQAAPPPWPGVRALPLLGVYQPRHRPFLARLVREGIRGDASPELLAAAGHLIVEGLPALSPVRREEPWVPEAIRELGTLRVEGAPEVLAAILRERRLLFRHAWPPACRAAAAAAADVRSTSRHAEVRR